MTLTIGNIKNGDNGLLCDRSTHRGNPFFMGRYGNEVQRDKVCDAFQDYHDLILESMEPFTAAQRLKRKYRLETCIGFKFPTREQYLESLEKIKDDDTLICWCYPKRCHCQTLVNWKLERLIK